MYRRHNDHANFLGQEVSFSLVATFASNHKVGQYSFATTGKGNHMIDRNAVPGDGFAAIVADVPVPLNDYVPHTPARRSVIIPIKRTIKLHCLCSGKALLRACSSINSERSYPNYRGLLFFHIL